MVLGEDIGAQVGLVLALGALLLAWATGNPVFDAIGSICIGVVLIIISIFVGWRIRSLLVGRSAEPDIEEAIEDIIAESDDIQRVYNVITMQFGPDTMLAAKIRMRPEMTVHEAAKSINKLERKLKKRIPNLEWCFIEPDITD